MSSPTDQPSLDDLRRRIESENAERNQILTEMKRQADETERLVRSLVDAKDQMGEQIQLLSDRVIDAPGSAKSGSEEARQRIRPRGQSASGDDDLGAKPGVAEEETKAAATDEVEEDSTAMSSEDDMDGFAGWARVFFQARSDREATQLHPTNSSTLSRDSYLYVTVDARGSELRVYPDDSQQRRLLVDPPVELRYFYAMRVPGSQAGAALFLRNDDRDYHRYIFRFEFRNDVVLHSAAMMDHLARCGKVAKSTVKRVNLKTIKAKTEAVALFKSREDHEEMMRLEEQKSQEAHAAYLRTVGDLMVESSVAAESFVGIVNDPPLRPDNGGGGGGGVVRRHAAPFWGLGFGRVSGDAKEGEESDSDFSDYDDVDLHDESFEEDDKLRKASESVGESFERMFEGMLK